jgi:hypothetical protein
MTEDLFTLERKCVKSLLKLELRRAKLVYAEGRHAALAIQVALLRANEVESKSAHPLSGTTHGKYYGVAARVAKALGHHRAHVAAVVRGERKSARIMAAYLEECRKVDAHPTQVQLPRITESQRIALQRGGRYFGVAKRVATELQVCTDFVYQVIREDRPSQRVLAAIHAEMARIDARLEAIK